VNSKPYGFFRKICLSSENLPNISTYFIFLSFYGRVKYSQYFILLLRSSSIFWICYFTFSFNILSALSRTFSILIFFAKYSIFFKFYKSSKNYNSHSHFIISCSNSTTIANAMRTNENYFLRKTNVQMFGIISNGKEYIKNVMNH